MDEMRIWVDEEFSVTAEDYEFRNARLTRAYGEIVTTPLLAPRQSASAGARGRSRGESRQNHTAGGDDGSLVDRYVVEIDMFRGLLFNTAVVILHI